MPELNFSVYEYSNIIREPEKKEKIHFSCSGSGRLDKDFKFDHLNGVFKEED